MRPTFNKFYALLLLTILIGSALYFMNAPLSLSRGTPLIAQPQQNPLDNVQDEAKPQNGDSSEVRSMPVSDKFMNLPGQSRTLLPDGRWLILGGNGKAGSQSAAWLMDPSVNSILKLPFPLLHPRAWHSSTVLPDGKVLIIGGIGANGGLEDRIEIFTPDTRMFEEVPNVRLTPRMHHTATLLTDGRLMVVGGLSQQGEILPVEFLDSSSKQRIETDVTLSKGRLDHTAALLPDGNVLLSGGTNESGYPSSYDEVFDSAAGLVRIASVGLQPADGHVPRLEFSTPAYGASEVPVGTGITLRFSQALAAQSVNMQTAVLSGPNGPVGVMAISAEGGMLAFISPIRPLLPNTTYTLTLRGAQDTKAAVLPDTYVEFTTAVEESEGAKFGEKNRQAGDNSFNNAMALPPLLAPAGINAVSGRALTLDGKPLPGVTLRIDGARDKTDGTGRFLLSVISPGHHELVIDGRTAHQASNTYGVFEAGVDVLNGQTTVLNYVIWMTPIDTAHAVQLAFPTRGEVVVTTPLLPGLEFRIPPNTTITDIDGNAASQISITPIPVQQPPFPLPQGVDVPLYFTIQPGGGYIAVASSGEKSEGKKGARLIYPNKAGMTAGTRVNFWNYEADGAGWFVYGQGTVTPDTKSIVPDDGVEIYELTGAMVNGLGALTGLCPAWLCSKKAGDPVDLGTGLFVYQKTDLFLDDVIPLSLLRTYRQNDTQMRDFGRGTTLNYSLNLTGDTANYSYYELLLPDGSRIRFDRTSPGTAFYSAYMENWSTPGEYYGAWINLQGGIWTLTKRDGTVMTFPQYRPLSSVTDRNGNVITITYRSFISSQVASVTSSNGRYINFTYDASDRISRAQDNIGRSVQYSYDANSYLSQVIDANGGVWKYAYDASGRMTSLTDARNIQYLQNQYDASGRVSLQTQIDGGTYHFAYTTNTSGQIVQATVTDPRNNVRRTDFDPAPSSPSGFISGGHSPAETFALGSPQQMSTLTQRQPGTNLTLSTADALGRVTTYTYDPLGNVTSITKLSGTPDAVTTTFTYDGTFSNIKTVTDPLGHTTRLGYDSKGNRTTIIDPMGHVTNFTYNSSGQVLTASDANGSVTQFGYMGGLLTSMTDPAGRTVSRNLDGAGRSTSITTQDGTTLQDFNPLNQVTRITDAALGVTDLTYDKNGNLLTVKDPRNNTTTFTYDNMDRLATRKDPLLNVESFQYDGKGNLVQAIDRRGKITTINYDALDRPAFAGFGTQAGPAFESTVTNIYDAGNRLTQSIDSITGAVSRNYDLLNRLTSEVSPRGTVSYGYDRANRQTSMTVAGQPAVSYAYDDANRPTQISQGTGTVSIAYDAGGRRTSLSLPNGVVTTYSYNAAKQLSEMVYTNANTLLGNLTYGYDNAGRTNRVSGSLAQTTIPGALSSTTYNANNQLTQRAGTSLAYDANGNLTSDGTNTYTWDARNQLASSAGGANASFQYDTFGRRTAKAVGGSSTAYLYDGASIVQELTGGSPTANLLNGGLDEVLTRTSASGADGILTDALGSTIALTDSSGSIQTQYSYGPFGKTTVSGAANTNQREYTGRENDGTGLYFYRARYYSPSLGRFISEDPLGFDGGDVNLYSYVGNNPMDASDPSGTSIFPTHGWETYNAARATGYSGLESFWMAWEVANVDRRPGSQGNDARTANGHAMGGTMPGRKPQNRCEAYDGTARYIAGADTFGAMHAIEDSYVHSYDFWDGGWNPTLFGHHFYLHLPSISHLLNDIPYNDMAEAGAAAYLRRMGNIGDPKKYLAPPDNCN